jgi:hypothetical protein
VCLGPVLPHERRQGETRRGTETELVGAPGKVRGEDLASEEDKDKCYLTTLVVDVDVQARDSVRKAGRRGSVHAACDCPT